MKHLPDDVTFITTQELEDRYPDKTPKERENLITKEYGCVFLMKIGDKLASGEPHDGRAPDYDDWQLNGDILRNLLLPSLRKQDARTDESFHTTKCFFTENFHTQSEEVLDSPDCVCSFSTVLM